MMCDLTTNPIEQVSVLDLACGEGVYAIEAALRGATVLAIDARTERMGIESTAKSFSSDAPVVAALRARASW